MHHLVNHVTLATEYKVEFVHLVQLEHIFLEALVKVLNFTLSYSNKQLDCPVNCATCVDGTTCLTCDATYGLYNYLCVTCPSDTYLHTTTGICTGNIFSYNQSNTDEACPTNCATCTNSNTCQTCELGFGLQNNLCTTCPSDTYLVGSTCISILYHFVSVNMKKIVQIIARVVLMETHVKLVMMAMVLLQVFVKLVQLNSILHLVVV